MKRIITIALAALVAGASFNTALADKKKKKSAKAEQQQETVAVKQPVLLTTGSDSLSYAAGITMTNGLMPYLQQQLKVDTAYMADFVRGFNTALAGEETPAQLAYRAGFQIADQVRNGMLPRIKQDFTDTPDSIVEPTLYRGFADAIAGDESVMPMQQAESFFKEKQRSNHEAMVAAKTKAGRDFLAANAKQEGVITTPSGLQYKVLVKGDGPVPQTTDKVKVNYEGRLIDGTVFDASSKHGSDPVSFRADQVIRGWTEALTMMPVGSKWQLYIPQELGYGERPAGNIPPYSVLIFDVELVGIDK